MTSNHVPSFPTARILVLAVGIPAGTGGCRSDGEGPPSKNIAKTNEAFPTALTLRCDHGSTIFEPPRVIGTAPSDARLLRWVPWRSLRGTSSAIRAEDLLGRLSRDLPVDAAGALMRMRSAKEVEQEREVIERQAKDLVRLVALRIRRAKTKTSRRPVTREVGVGGR
jgi:hypothetical protein